MTQLIQLHILQVVVAWLRCPCTQTVGMTNGTQRIGVLPVIGVMLMHWDGRHGFLPGLVVCSASNLSKKCNLASNISFMIIETHFMYWGYPTRSKSIRSKIIFSNRSNISMYSVHRFLRTTHFTNFAIYEPVQSVPSEILSW